MVLVIDRCHALRAVLITCRLHLYATVSAKMLDGTAPRRNLRVFVRAAIAQVRLFVTGRFEG